MTSCEMYVTRDGRWQCGNCGHVAWSSEMASAGSDTLCPACGAVVSAFVDDGEATGGWECPMGDRCKCMGCPDRIGREACDGKA